MTPRSLALPGAVALVAVGMAFLGGMIVGPGANEAVGSVLFWSSRSTSAVSSLGTSLALGFALVAGMVATVNPCGFVMLPAYLTLYVGDEHGTEGSGPAMGRQIIKALYVSAAVGLGFVLLFGTFGLLVSAGARSVAAVFPWIAFGLGFLMAGLGAYILAGGKLYTPRAASAAVRIGDPRDRTLRGYFLFGVSYAVASLSCTLPIFLGLISSSLATGGLLNAVGQFLAYALGMTFVITVLTIGIGVLKGAMVERIRSVMPYVNSISAGILIVVGGYLVFYWLTEGGLASHFGAN